MPRVIHLFDPRLDLDTAALRASHDGLEQTLMPVTEDWINALRVGMRLRTMPGLFSLHVWSESGLRAAVLSRGAWPVVLHVSRPLGRTAARLVRWLANQQGVQVRAFTPALRQHAISLGMVASRCSVVEPRCEPARWSEAQRLALRQSLGVAASDRVVLLPGAEQRGSGHLHALWSAVLVHVLDARLRVLTWGAGPGIERVRDAARRLGYPRMLVVARDRLPGCRFDELLPAADRVLVGDDTAPPLTAIQQSLASGVPTLLPPIPALRSFLRHPAAVVAEEASARGLASRLQLSWPAEPVAA